MEHLLSVELYNNPGHSNTRTGQIINVTFDPSVMRYIWVLCTASLSKATPGKSYIVSCHLPLLIIHCQK